MNKKSFRIPSIVAATSALIVTISALPASERDDRIETSIKNSYVFKSFLKDDSVKVESKDGAVTLTGTVAYPFHKALAQDTVESLPTVTSVENRLTVGEDNPAEHSDKWLTGRVKTVLLFHRNLKGSKTDVSAQNGIVTLQGLATSEAQKELITEYAMDVDGVTKVKNEMTVSEQKSEPERSIIERIDDASITAQIKTSLLTHRSTSALKTKVETREGKVTVSGIASNESEKTLVTKLLSDIDGVVGVANNMTVRTSPSSGN